MEFRQNLLEGMIGKTAQLTISYMDHIWLVLSLQEAMKDNEQTCSSVFVDTTMQDISPILACYSIYQKWLRLIHARSQYVNATLQVAGMVCSSAENQHQDIRPTEIKRSETGVEKVKPLIQSFLNPFIMETNDLVFLSTGPSASTDITIDVLKTESIGAEVKAEFIFSHLQQTTNFFQLVQGLKLKTLEPMNKTAKRRWFNINSNPTLYSNYS